jgi:hypothetical protein
MHSPIGDAVVGVVRRQVQHVARLQHELLFRLEVRQDLQRHAFDQGQVLLRADAPAALALRLQQEHVVGIEVRADAAAIGGVADHQVVQARVRAKRNSRSSASALGRTG